MKVTVLDRKLQASLWGNGYQSIYEIMKNIEISDHCPVCGAQRGLPELRRFCEDGEWFNVHTWINPCGHEDTYSKLIEEARLLATQKNADQHQQR